MQFNNLRIQAWKWVVYGHTLQLWILSLLLNDELLSLWHSLGQHRQLPNSLLSLRLCVHGNIHEMVCHLHSDRSVHFCPYRCLQNISCWQKHIIFLSEAPHCPTHIPSNLFWTISFPLNSYFSQWFTDGDLLFHILLHELKVRTRKKRLALNTWL